MSRTCNQVVGLLEDANLVTLHARRITLQPRDIQIVRHLRGEVLNSQEASCAKFGIPGAAWKRSGVPRTMTGSTPASAQSDVVCCFVALVKLFNFLPFLCYSRRTETFAADVHSSVINK